MKKGKTILGLLVISTIILSMIPNTINSKQVDKGQYSIILIENSSDYEKYGFEDMGVYYTPEALTEFHMPFIVERKGVMNNILKQDLAGDYKNKHSNFNKRYVKTEYNILGSNKDFFVIDFNMKTFAGPSMSVDFVPRIKNVEFPEFAWWNSSWNNYVTYTINSDYIDNDLKNLPVLVNISKSIADMADDGDSLRFVDISNSSEYFYEIDTWNTTNDNYLVWVNITDVDSSSDTSFNMYYNNSGVSSQSSGTDTFSEYRYVWHMDDSNGATDSVGVNDMTASSGINDVNGKIGNANYFNTDYLSPTYQNIGPTYHVSCWIKWNNINTDNNIIGKSGSEYLLELRNDFRYRTFDGGNGPYSDAIATNILYGWHMVTLEVVSGSGGERYYINTTESTDGSASPSTDMEFSRVGYLNDAFDAWMDELRIHNSTKNASWHKACYHTMNQTTDFFTNSNVQNRSFVEPGGFVVNLTNESYAKAEWNKGTNATTTIVEYNTASSWNRGQGTEIYNNTGETVTETDLLAGIDYYFQAWSYNSTFNDYRGPVNYGPVNIYGNFTINVYDADNFSDINNYSVFIKNLDGSSTYYNVDCSNPLLLGTNIIPTGDDCSITINATGYTTSVYYMDIETYTEITLDAYLQVNTTTESYRLIVRDEADNYIGDARIEISEYINDSYEFMSIWNTGSDGTVTVDLTPGSIYLAVISAEGFKTLTKDLRPITIEYYTDRDHIITLEYEDVEFDNATSYDENITFTATITGTTLTVTYNDISLYTENAEIKIYEQNTSNTTDVCILTNSPTSPNSFTINTGINTSLCYVVVLEINHTLYKHTWDRRIVCGVDTSYRNLTNETDFDNLFDLNYGTNPFGWSNIFGFFVLVAACFSFGERNSGIGMFLSGGALLFINYIIGLNIIGTLIPVTFIALGVLVQWNFIRRERG